ncbi:uncharacterized protein MELLADRAFT_84716 [Melampsora larici-populina 98AG31]|uniref:Alpha-type protein kinase domain-containing protein n=1 Tax=Melampsora larici-populina (strain 98AG31 / pathotype 3-4-7) TaxID=747676 RepID=F4RGL7_MELLP|nr:uncharacterized protein MELLADRAFT_84716 [Melampsora larici-populina 98AG31]EGG08626.1 hypothetical protein MELLADRAFT_84716 [Melampsora larici-populina 98AG31]
MPSVSPLPASDEAAFSETTSTQNDAATSVISTPSIVSTDIFIENPPIKSPTSVTAVHGSVETAGEESRYPDPVDQARSGQLIPTSRTMIKVRARPAVRHGPSQVIGHGAVICVSLPTRILTWRPDLPSKCVAFIYRWDTFYNENCTKPTYVPDSCDSISESVAVYQIGSSVDLSKTRDINEWSVREMQGNGVEMPYAGIVRFHHCWSFYAKAGRETAVELVNAHAYVEAMLQLFKLSLCQLWEEQKQPEDALAMEFRDWYFRTSVLHVPCVSLIQTIGQLDDDVPCWMICETAHHPTSKRYVYPSCFRDSMPASDPWKAIIFALIHYVYQKSGGVTLLAQVDCDISGILTNIVCFNKSRRFDQSGDVQLVLFEE